MKPAAIVVAKTALQTIKGETVVFVRTEDGFEARKIGVGRQDASLVEVTDGLAAGERVATANTFVLKAELGKAEAEPRTIRGSHDQPHSGVLDPAPLACRRVQPVVAVLWAPGR